MSTASRRKSTTVTQQLVRSPHAFSFFQAVRLLERSSKFQKSDIQNLAQKPIARFTPPATEAMRFRSHQTFSFPASEISAIKRKPIATEQDNKAEQWEVLINFMGLTGASGVLPYHYTELVLQRQKIKDESLNKFLDLFNHRLVSLFYQAASKYRLPIEYERKKLHEPSTQDAHSQVFMSLIGLGTPHLRNRFYTKDDSLLFYSGLFSQKVKTTVGLKQLLRNHFNIPVDIKEFMGQWQDLIDDVRTRLPSKVNPEGQNAYLGKSVMLGRRGWLAQGKIRIILGPLDSKQLASFAPGTKALNALNEIVRIYVGIEHDYDFIIRIKRKDIPDKIRLSKKATPIMGWNTWLASKPRRKDQDNETVDITVSASRFK